MNLITSVGRDVAKSKARQGKTIESSRKRVAKTKKEKKEQKNESVERMEWNGMEWDRGGGKPNKKERSEGKTGGWVRIVCHAECRLWVLSM